MGTTFYFGWEIKLMEYVQSFMGPILAKIMEIMHSLPYALQDMP